MSRRDMQQAQPSNFVIEMLHRYPFETSYPQNQFTLVKLSRRFKDYEFDDLRTKLRTHSQLRHPNLIRILRATVNRNVRHFNIYYQYVYHNIKNQIPDMTLRQIKENEIRLFELCCHLIDINIYPEIAEELLGIDQNGNIKLYLDVDFRQLSGQENKQDLLTAKQIEINTIFNKYLNEVPSVRALKHYKSAPNIQHGMFTIGSVTSLMSPIKQQQSRRASQVMRQSQVIEGVDYLPQHRHARISIKDRSIADESVVNYIDQGQYPKKQQRYYEGQITQNYEVYQKQEYPNDKQRLQQMNNEEHESYYTYNEELGDMASMPKISVTGLRQTAPSPKPETRFVQPQDKNVKKMDPQPPVRSAESVYNYSKIAPQPKNFKKQTTVVSTEAQSSYYQQPTNRTPIKQRQSGTREHPTESAQNRHKDYWYAMNNALSQQQREEQEQGEQQPEEQGIEELSQPSQKPSQRTPTQKEPSQRMQNNPNAQYMYMDADDPLTKQFNNLFESNYQDADGQQREISVRTNERSNVLRKDSINENQKKQINERVKSALEKSKAMLNFFYSNNPQSKQQ